MRVAIRADASVRLGTGHLVRCVALAEALATLDADVHFFCAEDAGLASIIEAAGFTLHRELEPERFVSMFIARLDATEHTLTYVNAGHVSGFVIDEEVFGATASFSF